MVSAAQRALDIAENRVHPSELGALYARTSTTDHHSLMSTARRGDTMKAGQPIGAHPSAGAQVPLRPSGDFGGAKSLHDSQLHAQRMPLLIGLDGGHERGLGRRPPPAFAPASLAAEIGVIEFDPTGEREVAVSLHHHLHQLVPDAPRRVVGDPQMAVQLHRRDPFLVLGHEVEGLEPHRQRQLGGVEDGSRGNRGLAMAAMALLELAAGQLAVAVMATVGAHEAIGPSPSVQGVEALVFGSVEGEEFVQTDSFLKLYWVARHGNILFDEWVTWRYSILNSA